MSINAYLHSVCTHIQTALPELRECAPHGGNFDEHEVRQRLTLTPSVLLAPGDIGKIHNNADGTKDWPLTVIAYCMTNNDAYINRGLAAMEIAETLITLAPEFRFSDDNMVAMTPQNLSARPVFSGNERLLVSIWAVRFDVVLRRGPARWPEGETPNDVIVKGSVYGQ